MAVNLKRVYEAPSTEDGERYLVERLWPRGVSKEKIALTDWLRDIAPSTELRKWYGHEEERWPEFVKSYKSELKTAERRKLVQELARKARKKNVTLVFATRDPQRSGARVLKDVMEKLVG